MRTKIVATLGPASNSERTIREMIAAGADMFRLNFSHGTLEDHQRTLETVRRTAEDARAVVAVMGDLCGPKIRLGEVSDGSVTLQRGRTVVLQSEPILGRSDRLSVSEPALCRTVQPGAPVLIHDGRVRLRAVESGGDELTCRVEVGGAVGSHQGINLPGTHIPAPALTEKDLADVAWAAGNELDFIAMSFVRRADDLRELRRVLRQHGGSARIIAKIEKPEAVEHIDAIIDEADGVLVARGDLGVEMEITRVPLLQKEITVRCLRAARPVIVATQMLQSMIDSPTPTRAEASDVANAVLDSVDAVMLSGETAVGHYPVRAVQTMNNILSEAEDFLARQGRKPPQELRADGRKEPHITSSVVAGAALVAEELNARCVVVWTEQGVSAQLLSTQRMRRPIVAVTDNPVLQRKLTLCYGVTAVVHRRPADSEELVHVTEACLLERRLAGPGDLVLVVAAVKSPAPGDTGAIYIHQVSPVND